MSLPVEYDIDTGPPYYLERERDNALAFGLYRDGAVVSPTSGTFTLQYGTTLVVNARSVTVASSKATVTVTASELSTYSYSPGWIATWSLLMPDGVTHVYRKSASLCRVRLACPTTLGHLLVRFPDLNNYLPSGQSTWQPQLDKVWLDVQMWLEGQGRRPYLVTDGYALLPLVEAETLAMIFELMAGNGDASSTWMARADQWRNRADHLRGSIKLEYDETDSGTAAKKVGASATLWLNGNQWRGTSTRPPWA